MGGRWNTYTIQLSFCALLILLSKIYAGCPSNSEGLALLEFWARVDSDPHDAFANWNVSNCDPCTWSGIGCVDGKVQKLDLDGFSLKGVLGPELGELSHLKILILSKNHFSGTIPKELGKLTMLEVLDLRGNDFNGTIPVEIGDMQSLRRLLLSNNTFEGDIPMELSKLNFLYEVQFDESVSSVMGSGICCLNRKLGHCVCQDGEKSVNNVDSFIVTVKGMLISYLNLFPLFKLGKNSALDHVFEGSDNIIQSVQNHKNVLRRRLIEVPTNLYANRSVDALSSNDNVVALPSTRSSGSFPAIRGKKEYPPSPAPSPASTTSPHQDAATNYAEDHQYRRDDWKYIIGISVAGSSLIAFAAVFFICRSNAAKKIAPWRTGLSGQLQKAFVTGVPKLNRSELETACEDFSNIIESFDNCTVYKGTLSSGVEIAVLSTMISNIKDWSRRAEVVFRKKIDTLSRVNHKNFSNLIGYCEEDEPFTRMMVFEYAPNGSLFEYLHIREVEHLDWNARTRIIMGIAYCLHHMHQLNPPVIHSNLNSSIIYLTDDYAAKVAEIKFWKEFVTKPKGESGSGHSELPPVSDSETNVYHFGILLLEIITGKLPHSSEEGPLVNWAAQYLNNESGTSSMVDPMLKSLKQEELNIICEVIKECIHQEGRKRPTMNEVITKLRSVIEITPEAATPRLSPLWWAELEILSSESS